MGSSSRKVSVLVVDDDRGLLRLIERALKREGLSTAGTSSGAGALAWLEENTCDLLLLDLKLQDMQGAELVEKLRGENCPAFIIITGQGDERVAVDMMKRGAKDYLVKDEGFLEFLPQVVRRTLTEMERERRLAEAEEQVRLIKSVVEQGFSAVLIADATLPDPTVLYINPAFAQATGYRSEDIVGKPLSRLKALGAARQMIREGVPQSDRFRERVSPFQTAEGERWGEWRVGPVFDNAGRLGHWLVIFRDITERKRLEKEILEISDGERQRIGQDLHDGICQHLAGIELMSQVLEQKLRPTAKSAAERAGELGRQVREVVGQTRSLARGLSPVSMDAGGLRLALEELAHGAETIFGIRCEVDYDAQARVRDAAVATHLYRIAQEAVSNAARHGKAAQVRIAVRQERERLTLEVLDNGKGFPQAFLKSKGMGLRIMQHRAGMIGATLAFANRESGGARVECAVPLRVPEKAE